MKKNGKRLPEKKNIIIFSVVLVLSLGIITGLAFLLKSAGSRLTRESYPLEYREQIRAAAEKYSKKYSDEETNIKVELEEALIYAVIKTESNFDPDARSSAGAIGLMQLMPETFEWMQAMYKDENDLKFEDLYDPELNIDYGAEALAVLLKMYDGEVETAVCAYNGGLGNVSEWLKNSEYSDDGRTLKKVPFTETDNYRRSVMRNKSIYETLYEELKQKA